MYHKKNLIAGILLTALLGPIGLFYASIWGGIILTSLPLFIAYIFSDGTLVSFFSTLIFIAIFWWAFWGVAIIWSVISIVIYNKKGLERYNFTTQHISSTYKTIEEEEKKSNNKVVLEWLKQHPNKTINDYYSSNK